MYTIRPIGRDEEGHPQGARYIVYAEGYDRAPIYYVPMTSDSDCCCIDFDVEVTDEWPGGWDMPVGS